MKLNFMRWIDYWIGIPICFIFSILSVIGKVLGFRRQDPNFKPKKILFLELSEMGSTIIAYSAMNKAKELFDAELHFMIFKENAESVRLLDLIPEDRIITIRSQSILYFLVDTIRALFRMRTCRIDTVVDLELFTRFTSILCFLSPAKAIVGFYRYHLEGLYRGNYQTHKVAYNPYYHMAQNFLSLIYSLTTDPSDLPLLKREVKKDEIQLLKLQPSDEDKTTVMDRLCNLNRGIKESDALVLLNPGASQFLPIRKWPIEYYIKLAEELLKINSSYFIVIIGVDLDRNEANAICNKVQNDRCLDFTGKTKNLKELVALFNLSQVLVTNDSGPAHFAALTDIKIITFFGPETPTLYSPLSENCENLYLNLSCSPCVSAFNHRKTTCRNNQCLKGIHVDRVLDSIKASLLN